METWIKNRHEKPISWKKTHIGNLPLHKSIVQFNNLAETVIKHSKESDEMYWIVFSLKEEMKLTAIAKLSGFEQFYGTVNFLRNGLRMALGGEIPSQICITYVAENTQGPPERFRVAIEFNGK